MARRRPERRGFGSIEKLPSGKYRAYYADPEGRTRALPGGGSKPLRHSAPFTFTTREDAEKWLSRERDLVSAGGWSAPTTRQAEKLAAENSKVPTVANYASTWIDKRRVKSRPLSPRTRDSYRDYLRRFVEPSFGSLHLDELTPGTVNTWYEDLCPDHPHMRAKVYSFVRAFMNTAVSAHGPIPGHVNPVAERGAGIAPFKRRDDQVVTATEFDLMLGKIREEWRPMLLLALWCGLRYGEIVALRRTDVDLKSAKVKITKAVSRSRESGVTTKAPKSEAGVRDQHLPPHVLEELQRHMRAFVSGRDGLLFPGPTGEYLAPATFYGKLSETSDGWYAARQAAGRADIHFHDLRATGATLVAPNATEVEVQAWLGDSTPQAAARYVRAARSRMESHAARMSELAKSGDW